MIKATAANIVVIPSQQVNPSVFHQLWLLEHGVFTKAELDSALNAVFLPVFVSVPTSVMDVLVMGERVQFTSKTPQEWHTGAFQERFSKFMDASRIAVSSIGFNWSYQITADGDPVRFLERARQTLLPSAIPWADAFLAGSSHIGSFLNRAIDDGSQQIDVRQSGPENSDAPFVACNFNFHFPVTNTEAALKKMEVAKTYYELARDQAYSLNSALA
ncbi:hypothetical protein [Burkholderia cepacia]|uniref:hypothetical protein n=1 Tax=Burkholderia cepacia TaxID=292 RepID=UPI000F5B16AD|nr:hypothetical protein [Burkholderia cepacia]